MPIDVKIDRGGIRDIEFLVQCLQRVYGGAEPWLRSGGTLFSLQKLHDKGHISGREFHDLTTDVSGKRRRIGVDISVVGSRIGVIQFVDEPCEH